MGKVAGVPLLLATLPLLVLAAAAQQTTSHPGSATGSIAPMHSGTARPNSGQFNSGRFNSAPFVPVRPNGVGPNGVAPPPPSWELPRVSTPHWEIPPNIPVQPNPVQGNPISRSHGVRGVGYVGIPYYADPFAFADANMYDDTAQQQQPVQPARPEYAPPQNYGPEEYPAARPPYNPEAYAAPAPQPATSGNGAADDGLDHPEVTLIFNDGRPPLKVHSYVLTGSSVFVAEHGHQRVIPVTELDLPATIRQNREAGVDFVLPGSGK
jgi:hypothetical protein